MTSKGDGGAVEVPLERGDLREVKDELIRVVTVEQKERGMAVPRPDLAEKYIADHRILEKTEAKFGENKDRHATPAGENEHTPDIEREIMDQGEALKRARAKYGKNADLRIWLHGVRKIDPKFAADFDEVCSLHIVMDVENRVSYFTPMGRMLLHKLLSGAIAKYGDPRNPEKKIQVGG